MTPKDRHEHLIRLGLEAFDRAEAAKFAEDHINFRETLTRALRERMAQAAQAWTLDADLGGADNVTVRELEMMLRERDVWSLRASLGAQWISLEYRTGVAGPEHTVRGENLLDAVRALLDKVPVSE